MTIREAGAADIPGLARLPPDQKPPD